MVVDTMEMFVCGGGDVMVVYVLVWLVEREIAQSQKIFEKFF